ARRRSPSASSSATVESPDWIAVEVIAKLRCSHAECTLSTAQAPIVRGIARCRVADLPPVSAQVYAVRGACHHRRPAVDALLSIARPLAHSGQPRPGGLC